MIVIAKLPKDIDRHVYLHIGGLFLIVSYLVIGPEELLCLPKSVYTAAIGIFLLGVGCSIVMVPSIPTLI
jgi:hypothetical protein